MGQSISTTISGRKLFTYLLLTALCPHIYLPLSVLGGLPELPIKLYVSLLCQSKQLWNPFLLWVCVYSSVDSRLLRVKLWIICFSLGAKPSATKMSCPEYILDVCLLKSLYLCRNDTCCYETYWFKYSLSSPSKSTIFIYKHSKVNG